mmetsp:Transcript_27140/g.54298  ORF Transcript_27140/g.54298 Transcript_27140/m.54298 type:complete len:278 (-) Transcript_27140:291-1124(-)
MGLGSASRRLQSLHPHRSLRCPLPRPRSPMGPLYRRLRLFAVVVVRRAAQKPTAAGWGEVVRAKSEARPPAQLHLPLPKRITGRMSGAPPPLPPGVWGHVAAATLLTAAAARFARCIVDRVASSGDASQSAPAKPQRDPYRRASSVHASVAAPSRRTSGRVAASSESAAPAIRPSTVDSGPRDGPFSSTRTGRGTGTEDGGSDRPAPLIDISPVEAPVAPDAMHLNSVDFPDPEEPKRTAGDVSGRKRTDSESAGRPDDDAPPGTGKNSRESGPVGG